MREKKELSPEQFRKMQLTELDMLVELDRVCRENGIHYRITGGTLLGAVRHKGFIPWDDDADVNMLREDYEKFKKIANQLNPEICWFQDHDTDPEYRWGYGKLRRTGTRYVRVGQEHLKCRTGIFIDIFPLDNVPNSTIGRMIQDFRCFILRKITYSEVGRVSEKETPFARRVYGLLAKIPIDFVFSRFRSMTRNTKNTDPNDVRVLSFKAAGKLYTKNSLHSRYGVKKEWLREFADYEFEGKTLQGPKNYHDYLTYMYGDYMQLPPPEKREQHSPFSEIDFGNL